MRGLKTLSSLSLILISALILAGGATAQDISQSAKASFNADAQYMDVNAEANRIATINSNNLLKLYDMDGNKLAEKSFSVSRVKVEIRSQDAIYTAQYGGKLVKRNSSLGEIWSNSYGSDVTDVALNTEGSGVYVGTKSNQLISLTSDGTKEWEISVGGSPFDLVELSNGRTSIITNGEIEVFDSSGTTDWTNTDSSDPSKVVQHPDGPVFAYDSAGGELMKINETDGSLIFSNNVNSYSYDISATNNAVYTAGSGEIKQLDLSGNTINTVNQANADLTSGDNGIVAFSGDNTVVYSSYEIPESSTVTEDSTNLMTGNFALSASAGIVTAVKGFSAGVAGLGIWELGVEDWLFGSNDADSELWKSDIRSNAVTLEDQRQNILNASELSEDALFGDAMATAKAEGVQAYNNGKTRQEAKEQVEKTVEDYYSDVERTVVNGYNNEILRLQNDMNNAESAGVNFDSVFKRSFEDLAIVNTTYTLPNGDELPTYYVVDDSGTKITDLETSDGVGLETESTGNHSSSQYIAGDAHYQVIDGVRTTRSNAITNVNSIIDNIYDNYSADQINVSDELSALELTESLSTAYGETGSYNYASASLARTGTPTDLDSAFNITYNGEDMEGALFASDAVVNGTVEAGTTYDGSAGNAVFVKQETDSAELIDLTGQFTVNSITSLDSGEDLNETSLQSEDAYTQDITDLQTEIDSLEAQLSNTEGVIGGSTGPTGNFFQGTSSILGIGVILGVIIVLVLSS